MIALLLLAQIIVTPANEITAVAQEKPGDTLVWTGSFPDVALTGAKYDPPVTWVLNGAKMRGLRFTNVSGINIIGGDLTPDAWFGAGYVMGSAHVHFHGLRAHGDGTVNLLTFRASQDVSIEDSALISPRVGVVALDVDGLLIRNVAVTGNTKDGFDITAVRNGLLDHVSCTGNIVEAADHPDCGQVWSAPGYPLSDNVTIRYSVARGPTQGFDDFGPKGGPYVSRFVLDHNSVFGSFPQGVATTSPGAVMRFNDVHSLPGSQYRTSANPGPLTVHCGNTAEAGGNPLKPAWNDGRCPNP